MPNFFMIEIKNYRKPYNLEEEDADLNEEDLDEEEEGAAEEDTNDDFSDEEGVE